MKKTSCSQWLLASLILSCSCITYAKDPCHYSTDSYKSSGTTMLCPSKYTTEDGTIIDTGYTGDISSGTLQDCSSTQGEYCRDGTYTDCIGNKYSCYDGTWTLTKENESLP